MVCNVGRMIAAMAMVTSSVAPARRGGFLSANSSMQHIASGMGAYLGGLIIGENPDGSLQHFSVVGWIAGIATLLSLWLAGRVRVVIEEEVSAEDLSLAAAAEATVDAGEPLAAGSEPSPSCEHSGQCASHFAFLSSQAASSALNCGLAMQVR